MPVSIMMFVEKKDMRPLRSITISESKLSEFLNFQLVPERLIVLTVSLSFFFGMLKKLSFSSLSAQIW